MADLIFPPFATNDRIRRAADNSPSLKPGDPDRAAVAILQQALIQAGFPIPAGATGFYGTQTAAAVQECERRHGLDVDAGVAGHQVITKLDALLTRQPAFVIRGADLQVLLQQTTTLGGHTHRGYLSKAEDLLEPFGLGLSVTNRRAPEVEFPGSVDPTSGTDIARVRELAEEQIPGLPGVLRVIFCRFPRARPPSSRPPRAAFTPLEGGRRVPDFVLIDVGKRRRDDCTLLHEMIHATGLEAHDPDSASVFSEGANRTVLKPAHAERLGKAFFARVRH